jgi:predicted amidophosphoribosyltransferase
MASRCLNCNGILTKTDRVCYSCGDKVPKWVCTAPARKKSKGSSIVSNVVFIASLSLTAFSLVAEHKPPLNVSLAASGALFAVKLIVDWTSRRRANSST